jgi:hypothetical protein
MRDVKLGRGHQRSTGLGHRGSRPGHRRCAKIHCSKHFFRSLRILSFTGFPDLLLTVLVITRLTTGQTGRLHPATVTARKAHNGHANRCVRDDSMIPCTLAVPVSNESSLRRPGFGGPEVVVEGILLPTERHTQNNTPGTVGHGWSPGRREAVGHEITGQKEQ